MRSFTNYAVHQEDRIENDVKNHYHHQDFVYNRTFHSLLATLSS